MHLLLTWFRCNISRNFDQSHRLPQSQACKYYIRNLCSSIILTISIPMLKKFLTSRRVIILFFCVFYSLPNNGYYLFIIYSGDEADTIFYKRMFVSNSIMCRFNAYLCPVHLNRLVEKNYEIMKRNYVRGFQWIVYVWR